MWVAGGQKFELEFPETGSNPCWSFGPVSKLMDIPIAEIRCESAETAPIRPDTCSRNTDPFGLHARSCPRISRERRRICKSKKPRNRATGAVAGGLGFEPRQPESESGVLPLDDPPSGRPRGTARLDQWPGRFKDAGLSRRPRRPAGRRHENPLRIRVLRPCPLAPPKC